MSKTKQILTKEEPVFDFRIPDLFGILLMGVVFVLILVWNHSAKQSIFQATLNFVLRKGRFTLSPNISSTIFACIFYGALIARYPAVFKQKNLLQAIVSSFRAFFNIWALATILSILMPTKKFNLDWFSNYQTIAFIFGLIMTWLGMRTIAGYSWIIFFITFALRLKDMNTKPELIGIFIVMLAAISLFLQVLNFSDVKDFFQDFRGSAKNYGSDIGYDMNLAARDAKERASSLAQNLDLNGDGKIDAEDFEILLKK